MPTKLSVYFVGDVWRFGGVFFFPYFSFHYTELNQGRLFHDGCSPPSVMDEPPLELTACHSFYPQLSYCILYTWVRASWIEFNNCPTRCDLFSLLHFCRQLYMFRVLTAIIRSSYNCNYSFWYWLTGSTTIRSRCWVGTDSCVSYGRYSFVSITNE